MISIENGAVTAKFIKFIETIKSEKEKFSIEHAMVTANDGWIEDYSIYSLNRSNSSKILIFTVYNFVYYAAQPSVHAVDYEHARMIIFRYPKDQQTLLNLLSEYREDKVKQYAADDMIKYIDSIVERIGIEEEKL
jgi:hypothetical protein